MDYTPEIECTDCDGYGFTMKRDSRLGPGIYEITCEACNGHGWRAMTDEERDDASANAFSDMCECEPPMTMRERHQADWIQHREAHR